MESIYKSQLGNPCHFQSIAIRPAIIIISLVPGGSNCLLDYSPRFVSDSYGTVPCKEILNKENNQRLVNEGYKSREKTN